MSEKDVVQCPSKQRKCELGKLFTIPFKKIKSYVPYQNYFKVKSVTYSKQASCGQIYKLKGLFDDRPKRYIQRLKTF